MFALNGDSCLEVLSENSTLKQVFRSSMNCGLKNKQMHLQELYILAIKVGDGHPRKILYHLFEKKMLKRKDDEQVLHQHSHQDC